MAKGIPTIKVNDEIRVFVEKVAKEFCAEREIPLGQFNQDCCAVVCVRTMKALDERSPTAAEVEASQSKTPEGVRTAWKLKAAKVCANASALRQKIAGESGAKTSTLVEDLEGLVED